ncbi:cache domain-containing protein [Thermodesulfobacteriota bacterium]
MKTLSKIINRLLGISLKWKLLLPFLFFAFTGTTALVFIGMTSQYRLIRKEERIDISHHYMHFLERLNQKKVQVGSLAMTLAENPDVKELLANKDRQGLVKLLGSTFSRLHNDFNISQIHFHTPPAISFLRLHQPSKYGDDIATYRKTILEVFKTGRVSTGLEKGATGLSLRGVSPVTYDGEMVGSVEVGLAFDKIFLENFSLTWDVDVALYGVQKNGDYQLISKVGEEIDGALYGVYLNEIDKNETTIMIAPDKYPDKSILYGPVKDFSNNVVAMVEFVIDRSEIQHKLNQTRNLMLFVGLAGISISFILTYLVIAVFIKPIKEIAQKSQDIALGKRESLLDVGPNDEVGSLAQALNTMLEALRERQLEIQDYARTLEKRVQERTTDLVASEDKYRALVENVPLIVYRVLRDGTTEFVNSFMTESLGYTIEEAVGDKRFWRDKISGDDSTAFNAINNTCFKKGEECRVENVVRTKDGRLLNFITHAIPAKDTKGNIGWIDGIMLDITELKRLQERALLTEEIRTLGEISAVMAHEIRNPLSSAGGFARRLYDTLKDNENKKLAGIIVEEVAKLEQFLKVLFSSIEPFDLVLGEVDINNVLRSWIEKLKKSVESKGSWFEVKLDPGIPKVHGDEDKLSQAFENILKHAIVSTPDGEGISIVTSSEEGLITIQLIHKMDRISEDDLEKFFFPHIERNAQWAIMDLPLSRIIIHRHGGKVEIGSEEDKTLFMKIEFPIISGETIKG